MIEGSKHAHFSRILAQRSCATWAAVSVVGPIVVATGGRVAPPGKEATVTLLVLIRCCRWRRRSSVTSEDRAASARGRVGGVVGIDTVRRRAVTTEHVFEFTRC
jgi:hypothetical protein